MRMEGPAIAAAGAITAKMPAPRIAARPVATASNRPSWASDSGRADQQDWFANYCSLRLWNREARGQNPWMAHRAEFLFSDCHCDGHERVVRAMVGETPCLIEGAGECHGTHGEGHRLTDGDVERSGDEAFERTPYNY